jgi:hypothetical protein
MIPATTQFHRGSDFFESACDDNSRRFAELSMTLYRQQRLAGMFDKCRHDKRRSSGHETVKLLRIEISGLR